jgi:hypothetical protein
VNGNLPLPVPVGPPKFPDPQFAPCAHPRELARAADEKTRATATIAARTRILFTTPLPKSKYDDLVPEVASSKSSLWPTFCDPPKRLSSLPPEDLVHLVLGDRVPPTQTPLGPGDHEIFW